MRFLIEASGLDKKQTQNLDAVKNVDESNIEKLETEYEALSSNYEKFLYLDKLLDKVKNKRFIDNNKSLYINGIRESNALNSNYMTYLLNLDRMISEDVADIIQQLILNKSLNPLDSETDWLHDDSLYRENEDAQISKIKILTFISNPQNLSRFDLDVDIDDFRDRDGRFLSAYDMKRRLNQAIGEEDLLKGSDLLEAEIHQINADNVYKYLIDTFEDFTSEMQDDLENGAYDNAINKILNAEYSNIDNLNKAFERLFFSKETRKGKDEVESRKITGEDVLRQEIPNYTAENIRKYIVDNVTLDKSSVPVDKQLKSFLLDGAYDDIIEKQLSSKIHSAMGRDLKTLLLTNIAQEIYDKNMKG